MTLLQRTTIRVIFYLLVTIFSLGGAGSLGSL